MSKSPSDSQQIDVVVTVHRKPACHVELEVKTSPALVAAARKDAIKKVGKEVVLPGFRKGHAPEEMIVKKHPYAIEKQWHKSIADAAFASAQLQARVPMLNTQTPVTFDLKKSSLEEGAELTFSFDTEPLVPVIDPSLFHPQTASQQAISEPQIDEAIHQMKFYFAEWHPVSDRGIQEGDYITIDLDTLDPEPANVLHEVRFQVSSERMAEWMRKLAIGAHAGDVLEGVSEADSTATEEEKAAATPKKVRLTIHRVEQTTLPDIAAFVQKMKETDEASLRVKVRSFLERNIEEKAQEELRNQVNGFLIHQYAFELPLSLIEAEKAHRKNQMQNDPKFRESYEQMSSEERKKMEEDLYTESAQAVRLFYLTRKLIHDAKIPVTHGEVQEEAARAATSFGQKFDPQHLPKEVFALALSKVILAKAQDYIMAHCPKNAVQEPKPEPELA